MAAPMLAWIRSVVASPPTACADFPGGKTDDGYGLMRYGPRARTAHSVAMELFTGAPIPEGMMVLHSCRSRACCNPKHLSIGTAQQNADDMLRDGTRPLVSLPRRGVAASVVVAVRLTPEEAAALDAIGPNRGETIRRLIAGGGAGEQGAKPRFFTGGYAPDEVAPRLVRKSTYERAGEIADAGALEAHPESIIGTAERVRDTIAGLGDPAPHRHTGAAD